MAAQDKSASHRTHPPHPRITKNTEGPGGLMPIRKNFRPKSKTKQLTANHSGERDEEINEGDLRSRRLLGGLPEDPFNF